MREIKFRGKRVDNGEWVYGYLLQTGQGSYITEYSDYTISTVNIKVNPSTVGQYTGLKDRKGKEIYGAIGEKGGDVVYIAGQGNIYISCFPFYELYEKIFCGEGDDIGEVIGNAIENPELLNQNQ